MQMAPRSQPRRCQETRNAMRRSVSVRDKLVEAKLGLDVLEE